VGREARCDCRWGNAQGPVTALLEPAEIILRGAIKRRVALAALTNLRATADGLGFTAGGEAVLLALPPAEAEKWVVRINTPPPSLRQKLGLDGANKALVCGGPPEGALADAVRDAATTDAARAHMSVAIVGSVAELQAALKHHAALPKGAPIWVVHGKGRAASFGEAAARTFMRDRNFIDSKVAAISATQTATRYALRQL
jgi:hypothetical protein